MRGTRCPEECGEGGGNSVEVGAPLLGKFMVQLPR